MLGKEVYIVKQRNAYIEKMIRANGDKLGNDFTANFHRRMRPINSIKYEFVKPYVNQGLSLLDLSVEIGSFLEARRKEFPDLAGLETMPIFADHPVAFPRETQKLDNSFRGRKFDIVLMVNYLEYEYCPYSRIVEAVSRLKKNGKLCLAVPINNDPQKNFKCRMHEFSKESFKVFLQSINMPCEMISDSSAIITTLRQSQPVRSQDEPLKDQGQPRRRL